MENNDQETLVKLLKEGDIPAIKQFGAKKGFLDVGLRAKAYMAIFKIDHIQLMAANRLIMLAPKFEVCDVLENDIKRSFTFLQVSKELTEEQRDKKKIDLTHLITSMTTKNPDFTYYQGFNYISEMFLMVYGKHLSYVFLENLSLLHFKPYFGEVSFEDKIHERLLHIFAIMKNHYPDAIATFAFDGEEIDNIVSKFAFAISWLLCWFSYKISKVDLIYRIFDYLICSEDEALNFLVASVLGNMFKDLEEPIDSRARPELLLKYCFTYDLEAVDWEAKFKESDNLMFKDNTFVGKTFHTLGKLPRGLFTTFKKIKEKRKKRKEEGKKSKIGQMLTTGALFSIGALTAVVVGLKKVSKLKQ